MKSSETWIAKMAEEKYKSILRNSATFYKQHNQIINVERNAYSAGAKDMKEHLAKAMEFTREAPGNTWLRANGEILTTDQLIEKYFEYLISKKNG